MFLNTEAGRFLVFEKEKLEENFLSEGMEKLISPLRKTWTPNRSKKRCRGCFPAGKLIVLH